MFADQYRQYGPLAFSIRVMANADAIKAREALIVGRRRNNLAGKSSSTATATAPTVLQKPLGFLSCGPYVSDLSDDEDPPTNNHQGMLDSMIAGEDHNCNNLSNSNDSKKQRHCLLCKKN